MYENLMDSIGFVAQYDPDVASAMAKEHKRQQSNIELIASENFVSPAVMAAMGSILTNKYAEGLPGKRYYGGCVNVDIVEDIARERAKKLFGADHANVQPHSGAQANMAAYSAVIEHGDTVMGMNLAHGGHLIYDEAQTLPLPDMYGKNLVFKTGGVDGCDCAEILALIEAGKIDTTPLITHRCKLEDIEEAYRIFENKLDGVIKVAVTP